MSEISVFIRKFTQFCTKLLIKSTPLFKTRILGARFQIVASNYFERLTCINESNSTSESNWLFDGTIKWLKILNERFKK